MNEIIGIQGGKASYTERAARSLKPRATIKYFETFRETFDALYENEVDRIVVAIANNRIQLIPDVYEELIANGKRLEITGEEYLKIEHALLGLPGSRLEEITEVHSQAPAIGQCTHFLEGKLPNVHLIEEHDTAGSAKIIADLKGSHAAAIASVQAGRLYNLISLETAIQNDPGNITRFIEISLKAVANAIVRADKTSALVLTSNAVGSLAHVLQIFMRENIGLTYIQSQIIPNSAFEINFFIEFDAGIQEQRTITALDSIQGLGFATTILGSYKTGTIPLS